MHLYLTLDPLAGANTDRGEVLKHLPVLLPALSEAPVILVQEGVEVVQHGYLLVQRDAHVVFHRVQRSQHQVENTNGVSALIGVWRVWGWGDTGC